MSRPAEPAAHAAVPPPPTAARELFGAGLSSAAKYAELLAGPGVERGLIGPRETPRLWERHLLNCALVADLLPQGATFVDVGSGAGLPGVPMLLRRPDLSAVLLEPMQRRVDFLTDVVRSLGLAARVRVVRARADDEPSPGRKTGIPVEPSEWVTARAVAPLDRLVKWCLPLLVPGGALLAMKGANAEWELRESRAALRRAGAGKVEIVTLGAGASSDATRVVIVPRARQGQAGPA